MSVVVGIVTRNRAGLLPKSIASVFQQRGCSVRLAVIDDASTDDTVALARDFPTVDWIHWSVGRGYMAARNWLMSSAQEDYFVSLDDDAWFLRGDEIETAIRLLEQRPEVAAVAYDILSPDRPDATVPASPRAVSTFIGCGHVLRLSAVRLIGGYEPTPGSYGGEEKDMCLRLMDAGYKVVLLPGVHVWHDKTQIGRAIPEQYRSSVCNDLVMALRRSPVPVLGIALLHKVYRHLKFARTRGLMRPCLRGITLFARSIPSEWRSRRPVRLATLRAFTRLSKS